jgi:protein FrlC
VAGVLEHGKKSRAETAVKLLPSAGCESAGNSGGGSGFNPASPFVEEREATVEQYKQAIDLASDLGATKVLYIAGWQIFGTTHQEAWSPTRDCLDRVAAYASQKDIIIVVEPTAATTNLIQTTDA